MNYTIFKLEFSTYFWSINYTMMSPIPNSTECKIENRQKHTKTIENITMSRFQKVLTKLWQNQQDVYHVLYIMTILQNIFLQTSFLFAKMHLLAHFGIGLFNYNLFLFCIQLLDQQILQSWNWLRPEMI